MRALAVILLAVGLAMLSGCGQIGEPLYPALRLPSPVTDLTVLEVGTDLDINFTIPPLTVEGLQLKEIGAVDLRVGPAPKPWNEEAWEKTATRIDVPAPAGPGPVQAKVPVGQFVGKDVAVAVRVSNQKGKDGEWSSPKTLAVQPPIADPANFHVAADPKGVALTWKAPGLNEFRIFRRTEEQTAPALLATATEPDYLDISAQFGKTYQYSIQAVRGGAESNIVGPETITPANTFPPSVPSGLTASIGVGTIELAWNPNTEPNFKEFRVLRSMDGGPFAEIAHGLDTPVYSDHMIQSGMHYRYEVEAAGQNGHVSAPSAPVEITAP